MPWRAQRGCARARRALDALGPGRLVVRAGETEAFVDEEVARLVGGGVGCSDGGL